MKKDKIYIEFTGTSAAGKTTISKKLIKNLLEKGRTVESRKCLKKEINIDNKNRPNFFDILFFVINNPIYVLKSFFITLSLIKNKKSTINHFLPLFKKLILTKYRTKIKTINTIVLDQGPVQRIKKTKRKNPGLTESLFYKYFNLIFKDLDKIIIIFISIDKDIRYQRLLKRSPEEIFDKKRKRKELNKNQKKIDVNKYLENLLKKYFNVQTIHLNGGDPIDKNVQIIKEAIMSK